MKTKTPIVVLALLTLAAIVGGFNLRQMLAKSVPPICWRCGNRVTYYRQEPAHHVWRCKPCNQLTYVWDTGSLPSLKFYGETIRQWKHDAGF